MGGGNNDALRCLLFNKKGAHLTKHYYVMTKSFFFLRTADLLPVSVIYADASQEGKYI